MKTSILLAAALAATLAPPALAMGPHARSEIVQQRQQEARVYKYYRRDGVWPGAVAAGVVGGAVGTAGAIAGAPFGYEPYDPYYRGPYAYGW
jgi:uncharacterized membrane protein YdfJ with MMPL/SSD domain